MEFQKEPGRIFALDETGGVLAEVTFPTEEDGSANIDHTFVASALRGTGVADQLLRAVAETLRETGQKARPTCSYAAAWFDAHPENKDLLK